MPLVPDINPPFPPIPGEPIPIDLTPPGGAAGGNVACPVIGSIIIAILLFLYTGTAGPVIGAPCNVVKACCARLIGAAAGGVYPGLVPAFTPAQFGLVMY